MIENILNRYRIVAPVHYSQKYIQSQIDILRERSVIGEIGNTRGEMMFLDMICSLLKYYIKTSVTHYQTLIVDIVVDLEQIFNIDNLLEKILEIEDEM